MREVQQTKVISEEEVKQLRLRGKPRCPFCKIPLTYVYEGSSGFTNQKCERCRNSFLVDSGTLEVMLIQKVI